MSTTSNILFTFSRRLQKSAVGIITMSLLLLSACTGQERSVLPDETSDATVFMNIGVSVNDIGSPARSISRATGPGDDDETLRDPEEGEKMNTLRLIIVRPDGTVEANRYVDNLTSNATIEYTFGRIRVNPQETKTIYLIANENSKSTDGRRLIGDINLDNLSEGYWIDSETGNKVDYPIPNGTQRPVNTRYVSGSSFPYTQIEELVTPALDIAGGQRLSSAAPGLLITEKHSVEVGLKDVSEEYSMLRAATKFTVNFENNSGHDITLKNIKISGIATHQFVIPRHGDILSDWDSTEGDKIDQITSDFTVPEGMDYQAAPVSASDITIAKDGMHKISPLYFPEGKATENVISFTVNGAEFSAPLPNPVDDGINHGLPYSLPRNTHVVINVKFSLKKVDLVIDVIPFTLIELSPEYGLERDEETGWLKYPDEPYKGWLIDPVIKCVLKPGTTNEFYDPITGDKYDPNKDPSIEAP